MGLRFLGIPLDPLGIRSPFLRRCCITFGWISFLSHLIGNFVLFLHLMDKVILKLASKSTSTSYWSILINNFNNMFLVLMNHAGLFLYVCPNWRELMLIIGRIESLQLYNQQDQRSIRRIFFIGNIFFTILVSTLFYHLIWKTNYYVSKGFFNFYFIIIAYSFLFIFM